MKQIGLKTIKGTIVVKTGLHIGAGNDKIEIGGMDNPIIRNPLTREPYIPGSSLKGKMRALLEWDLDKVMPAQGEKRKDGEPCNCGKPDCKICRVFGSANGSKNSNSDSNSDSEKRGPTRLIMRDAILNEKWKEDFKNGKPIIEEKNENSINRITAEATPRPIERVVPGVEFDFELSYKIIDTNDDGKTDKDYFESVIKKGLKLLQNDYIGGGGSRGNGQIEFKDLKIYENADDTEGKTFSL